MKKGIINGEVYTIYNIDEIENHTDDGNIAIETHNIVYPVISKTSSFQKDAFGVIIDGALYRYISKGDVDKYKSENVEMIDFSNTRSMKEQIEKNRKLREMEESVLITPDKIFKPVIKPTDLPEMIALKEAINAKNIDLDKYSQRFGDNYNNDRRLLDKPSITLSKIRTISEALDMSCYITFEDKSPDVPNPIGKKITYRITNIEDGIERGE